MSRNFGAGSTPLRRSGVWIASLAVGVPFGLICLGTLVSAFQTSADEGWRMLKIVGFACLTVGAFLVAVVLISGLPRWLTWRAVRRQNPGAIVLMCRRTTGTARAAAEWTGRTVLSTGRDEFFIALASGSRLEIFRIGRSQEPIALSAPHEELSFETTRAEAFVGSYWAVRITRVGSPDLPPFDFFPLRSIGFGVLDRGADEAESIVRSLDLEVSHG